MKHLWHTCSYMGHPFFRHSFTAKTNYFLHTILQFDPKQKALCVIPTSLHFQTIITVTSAKRRRPHRKSRRSPPRHTESHTDRLSLHSEVTGRHPESSPTTSRPPHCSSLFVTHLGDIIPPSWFQLAGGEVRRRSGSGSTRTTNTHWCGFCLLHHVERW